MSAYEVAMAVAGVIGRRRREIPPGKGCEILLTGTFYSDNWIGAHLRPLAAAEQCARVTVVSTYPIPDTPKVVAIYPPGWLRRVVGAVPARMMTFAWVALRRRPHYVGGFHLLFNGMAAVLIARVIGARSLYWCVGGPTEVLGGGCYGENRLMSKLGAPDPVLESRLLSVAGRADGIITMGNSAAEFFRMRGLKNVHVIPGGMDPALFGSRTCRAQYDIIFVGRLARVKRVDVLLRALERARRGIPGLSAVIVGDGVLRTSLEEEAAALGIAGHVTFVGHQSDVQAWLRRASLFVLTSDSEGLALSLIEAMMCGLPAVVSDVGDLGDLVADGANGYLVPPGDVEAFSSAIAAVLGDEERWSRFSLAARMDAQRLTVDNVSARWARVLGAALPASPVSNPKQRRVAAESRAFVD